MIFRAIASRKLDFILYGSGLLLFLSLVIPSIQNTSRTGDEGWLMRAAHEVVSTGRWETYDSIRHPPLSFYTYGIFLSEQRDARGNLRLARYLMLVYPLVLGIALYGFARRVAGRGAAFAALLLLALDPNILAHSSLITTDMCAACTFFLAFVAGVSAMKRGSLGRALLTGFCLGLALLAKYTGILLLPILVIVALWPWRKRESETSTQKAEASTKKPEASTQKPETSAQEPDTSTQDPETSTREPEESTQKRRNSTHASREATSPPPSLAHRMRNLILIFAIALLMIHLAYGFTQSMGADYHARSDFGQWLVPSDRTIPLVPAPYIMGLDRVMEVMELGHPAYFNGEFFLKNQWHFYPVAFAWKEPVIILGFMVLGLFCFIRRKGPWWLLLPVLIPLASFMFLNDNFVGVRHLLVVYPMLFLIASLTFEKPKRAILGCISTLLLIQLILTANTTPHYLSFFNEFTHGPKHGDRYLLDSNYDWGQDYDALLKMKESSPDLIKDSPGPYPTLGWVAVSPMDFQGYPGTWEGHDWLSEFTVDRRVGNTWRLYHLNLEDFAKPDVSNTPKQNREYAWALHEAGQSDEALKIFHGENDACGQALILLDQGKASEALRVCESAAKRGMRRGGQGDAGGKARPADHGNSRSNALLELHAMILEAQGRSEEAEALFLESTAASVERSYLDGAPSLDMADYANPDDALHLNNTGYILWNQGRLEEAADNFRLATEKDPLFADPWGNLAAVSAHLCRRELLKELGADGINSGNDSDNHRSQRASYAAAALNFRAKYLKLITLPTAWWAKRVDYRTHVAIYPGIFALPLPGPNALELLAEKRPLSLVDRKNLGMRHLLDNETLHAARAFLSVLREQKDDAISLYHMGVIQFRNRLYRSARENLEQAIAIDPGYAQAREALAYMNRYLQR